MFPSQDVHWYLVAFKIHEMGQHLFLNAILLVRVFIFGGARPDLGLVICGIFQFGEVGVDVR